jgi:hypothetical protein
MARTRFEHDDRDDYQPPRRRQSSPALVIGLVVGGLMLLGALVCSGAMLWFGLRVEQTQRERDEAAAADAPIAMPVVKDGVDPARLGGGNRARLGGVKLVYTRDKFKTLVMGKTTDEVIAAVGQPDGTQERPDGTRTTWHYDNRVTNPATTKPSSCILEFKDGKVVEVRW